MLDEDKEGIGYVPDESDDDEAEPSPKLAQEEAALKKKGGHKRGGHRPGEAESHLRQVLAERDEFKDKYLRGLAEIDNFRTRMKKERDEFQKYVLSQVLLDLLQIYDNLERALKAKTSEHEKGIISGVEMIRKQFLDLLKKYQVLEIEALGRAFDPAFHEALSKEERVGINAPVVIEVYQKGFTYQDKLLRPALTKVAIPPAAEPEPDASPDAGAAPSS